MALLFAVAVPVGGATARDVSPPTDPVGLSASGGSGAVRSQRCFGAASRDPRERCRNTALRRAVEPSPFDAIIEPSEPCQPLRGVGVDACSFGASRAEARGTFALIGDSHATHWRAALAQVAANRGLRGISITRSGCPLTLAQSRGAGRCTGWAERVIDWLGDHPEVTGIVTSASTGSRVVQAEGLTARETAVRGYAAAWEALPASVRDVWLIRDVPHMSWDVLNCVNQAITDGSDAGVGCARPRLDALRPDLATVAFRRTAPERVNLVDLTAFMCDAKVCFPVVGGALVSKDAGHLTRTFSLTMGPYLARAMTSTGLAPTRPAATTPVGTTPASATPPAAAAPTPQ